MAKKVKKVARKVKKVAKKISKKTPKKVVKATKKPVRKVSKSKKKHVYKKVSGDKVFFMIDGTTVGSLYELADAFDRMSDDIFYYHVTQDRNDFANWTRDILQEEEIAEKLIHAGNPMKAQVVILRHFLGK